MNAIQPIISSAYFQYSLGDSNWLLSWGSSLSTGVIHDWINPKSGYLPCEYRLIAFESDKGPDACNSRDECSSRAPRRTFRSA
ncbi:hypothetical protein CXB36_03620 [Pseudomonas syringae pv. syringae]|nr:hypothetical protein BKC06_004265 [Pseudomonas syringae pv. syringae]PBP82905.1 hypothetical protein CCL16_19120 [Pseudomonas syringae]POP68021.1 hypothetical protein CXB36_03620 [Pseudomonas syringae pv. syringae]PPS40083.1 hypothetical protein B0F86_16935 [Pseudomonas syringae]